MDHKKRNVVLPTQPMIVHVNATHRVCWSFYGEQVRHPSCTFRSTSEKRIMGPPFHAVMG